MFDRLIEILAQAKTLRAVLVFSTTLIRLVPALLVILALTPSFVAFAFLADKPRRNVLDIVDRLAKWTLPQS
ncbi:hypothetical protein ACFXKR_32345 [Streptomyces violascens]|uniref:hypothetical protein n=1 Tax=Streptomyces violascens TaxID=67381 RepID=UPI0036947F3B